MESISNNPSAAIQARLQADAPQTVQNNIQQVTLGDGQQHTAEADIPRPSILQRASAGLQSSFASVGTAVASALGGVGSSVSRALSSMSASVEKAFSSRSRAPDLNTLANQVMQMKSPEANEANEAFLAAAFAAEGLPHDGEKFTPNHFVVSFLRNPDGDVGQFVQEVAKVGNALENTDFMKEIFSGEGLRFTAERMESSRSNLTNSMGLLKLVDGKPVKDPDGLRFGDLNFKSDNTYDRLLKTLETAGVNPQYVTVKGSCGSFEKGNYKITAGYDGPEMTKAQQEIFTKVKDKFEAGGNEIISMFTKDVMHRAVSSSPETALKGEGIAREYVNNLTDAMEQHANKIIEKTQLVANKLARLDLPSFAESLMTNPTLTNFVQHMPADNESRIMYTEFMNNKGADFSSIEEATEQFNEHIIGVKEILIKQNLARIGIA